MPQPKEEGERLEGEDVISLEGDEDLALQMQINEAVGSAESASETSLKALQAALLKKTEEAKKAEQQYLYILADFGNYKKRVQKDSVEQAKFANERLIKELLVVLDDLNRAILHSKETEDFATMREGLDLILKQFSACLNRFGVTPIDCLHKVFDPAFHLAVGAVERPEEEQNRVIEEIQKGYFLHDRVIRPSTVLIARKGTLPERGESSSPESENSSQYSE